MKLLLYILFLYQVSRGSTWETMGHELDPVHPGKCVIEGLILSPWEIGQPSGKCKRVFCYDASGLTSTESCPSVHILDSQCEFADYIDVNATYPKCCQREIICKKMYL